MKTILTKTLRTLFFPILWCRQVILEASEACLDYSPVGYADYMNFRGSERSCPTALQNAANQTFRTRFASGQHF